MVDTATARPCRIILQARTTSTRLPAKVLLPVGGHALSVLSAHRLMRGGADVVVATSVEPQDDLLAQTLEAAGITVYRGSLNDVRSRFLDVLRDLPDTAVCVRVTADNPVPDAEFIGQCLDLFEQTDAQYLAYGNDGQWLPYGVSAEVFEVGALRACAADSQTEYDQEHVTPAVRAAHAPDHKPAFPGFEADLGHLRCTVDTLDDYLRMAQIFAAEPDPVGVSYRQIIERLNSDAAPSASLVLGTVQLGLAYGVTKDKGVMSQTAATQILARAAGPVTTLDTARAYGVSEDRIGAFLASGEAATGFEIITKLDPIDVDQMTDAQITQATRTSVETSLRALGVEALECCLLHRAALIETPAWDQLCALQDAGQIGRLGVSVQTPQELGKVLAVGRVSHVQLPFNLLDWRWAGQVAALRHRPDVTVHLRSVFLQGLLVTPTAIWPAIEGVNGTDITAALRELITDLGRKDAADVCLAYCRALSWVDGIVCGVDTPDQLSELIDLFDQPALTWDEVAQVNRRLGRMPETLLNPALWPRAE